jgi:Domain of unknown function (DUF6265)
MNLTSGISFLLVIGLLSVSCTGRKDNVISSLSKIEGVWSMPSGDDPQSGSVVEVWNKVNDTLYVGKGYEVLHGDSVLSETIQIVADNGDIFYIATVLSQNNRQPVKFRLTSQDGHKFTFENPQHDFPTSVIYEFQNDSTLKASISGTINGEVRAMDLLYSRK